MSLWNWLLNPSGLTAHGFCLSWAPGLIAVHAGSDAVIGLAYYSIPLAIAVVVRERKDLEFRWVAYLFAAFILACGATHMLSILTLWVPAYGIEGLVKVVTAALSIATSALLWPLIPKVLALPSQGQLRALNAELSSRIHEQEHTAALLRESEAQVRAANTDLERRVAERTGALEAINAELVEALAARTRAEADLLAAKRSLEETVAQRSAALDQRDLLLREVYHRVKNNLQMIDSLVVMRARQLADPQAASALQSLRNRIYALGLVHQQLMDSADLRTFDIAPFLHELSRNIIDAGASGEIALNVEACALEVGLDFAIPLGLLVTELLTNSLKHAFPNQKGAISVELDRIDQGEVVLVVADNGVGVGEVTPAEATPAGLGQRIIAGLVAQLQGSMTADGANGMRTEVRITRPLAA
jgi:two-component sensor histidine kinase